MSLNVSFSSKSYYLQEEEFWKSSMSSDFAYLRIPDDYLDSSVLLASEIWDSCLWKCKNVQHLKTAVNLVLQHLILLSHNSLWLMKTYGYRSCCTCYVEPNLKKYIIKSNSYQ